MRFLAVDCSSENLSFCAVDGARTLFNVNRRLRHGASQLVAYLERCLKKEAMEVKDFDALVIGAGPGSFTGLRISFSVTKAFAIAAQLPVFSLESFYACAYAIRKQAEHITVIGDARKNLLYRGRFTAQNGTITKKGKTSLITLDELETGDDPLIVVSHRHLRKEISRRYPAIAVYPRDIYPQARFLVPFAEVLCKKGMSTPLARLQPLYLHPKTCQIRQKTKT